MVQPNRRGDKSQSVGEVTIHITDYVIAPVMHTEANDYSKVQEYVMLVVGDAVMLAT